MVTVSVDVDLSDVLDSLDMLSKRELRELRDEVNELLGKSSGHACDQPDVDVEHAYRALQLMRAGDTNEARWELERAFNPPVSNFLRGCFVKEQPQERTN
jgi:hypothetical protein